MAEEQAPRPCKMCGMMIRFYTSPAGKTMPVQKLNVVYRIVDGCLEKIEVDGETYVSHFETCREFHRRQKSGAKGRI